MDGAAIRRDRRWPIESQERCRHAGDGGVEMWGARSPKLIFSVLFRRRPQNARRHGLGEPLCSHVRSPTRTNCCSSDRKRRSISRTLGSIAGISSLTKHGAPPWKGESDKRDERAPLHSITSSARASSEIGKLRPSVFAIFKLITSSTLVDCWTGRSAGFVPVRIRPV